MPALRRRIALLTGFLAQHVGNRRTLCAITPLIFKEYEHRSGKKQASSATGAELATSSALLRFARNDPDS
jgi:hypothetical protein